MIGPPPPNQPAAEPGAPSDPGMKAVVRRNIRALAEVRQAEERRRPPADRIADAVTRFAGSLWCVVVHAALVGLWIAANLGWISHVKPWDPFPFVMLAMIASIEAIFLSTFILISQNRMQKMADRRAELDLQISLLTEHELTRAITMLDAIARRLDAPHPAGHELADIERDVHPEKVAAEIERAEGGKE